MHRVDHFLGLSTVLNIVGLRLANRTVEAVLDDEHVPAYLDEEAIPPDSTTETLAEVRFAVETWRWTGVPFRLRSGKALSEPRKEIVITCKAPPRLPAGLHGDDRPERLLIGIGSGADRLHWDLHLNGPDDPTVLDPVTLEAQFCPGDLSEYGQVRRGILSGDPTLSVRGDTAVKCWRILERPCKPGGRAHPRCRSTPPAATGRPTGRRLTREVGDTVPEQLLDFTGKVVLVTGGASGIGRATALAFARQGATVVIGDIGEQAADTVQLIEEAGGTGRFVEADVSVADQVEHLVRTTVDTFGGLHVAFNNAGVLPPSAALVDQTEDDFDRTIAVDLKGVFLCMKHEIAHMVTAGGGSIVNTSSVAGVIADPAMAPYAAAKHGVIGLTKAAALDYASAGVRVNAVAPGLVATAMTEDWMDDPQMRAQVVAQSRLGRPAEPEEVAGMVLYLSSPLASFVTGGVFLVDAGQTAH